MKNNIIEKVMANHSSLGEFVNGMEFIKEVHSLYKSLGGMKNYKIAKGIIKYVANENELGWEYVMQFISYIVEQIDKKGITSCKENIDWEQACIKCFPKELELVKTKSAFKDLFYLVALNNNDNVDNLLMESTLSAYGWHLIVKSLVSLYEEMLSTSTEFAEPHILLSKDEESASIMEESEAIDTPTEEPKVEDESPSIAECPSVTPTVAEITEPLVKSAKTVPPKKYARGRTIVLVEPDGARTEWVNAKAIEKSIGIPEGSIRKNVSGNSTFIRYKHKIYKASYKEAC